MKDEVLTPVTSVHRSFSLFTLQAGQGLSAIGSGIYQIALAWEVVRLTKSALLVGTILIAAMIPTLIISFFGSTIGDLLPKRRILIACDSFSTVISLVWGISLLSHTPNMMELYGFAILIGSTQAFFIPAYRPLLAELSKQEQISRSMTIYLLVTRFTGVIAPALGGILISHYSFALVVILNSVSYALALCSNLFIPIQITPMQRSSSPSLWKEIVEGWSYFVKQRPIFWNVILIAVANLAAVSLDVNLPKFIQLERLWTASTYGTVLSCYGIGSMFAFAFLLVRSLQRHRGLFFLLTMLLGGSTFLLIPVCPYVWQVGLILGVMGLAFGFTGAIGITLNMELADVKYRSRVIGMTVLATALQPLGIGLCGAMGDKFGNSLVFSAAGIIIMLVAAFGFTSSLRITQ